MVGPMGGPKMSCHGGYRGTASHGTWMILDDHDFVLKATVTWTSPSEAS